MRVKDSFTLIIPTRNRPAFLRRCLSYYKEARFEARILLLDSSTDEHRAAVEDAARILPTARLHALDPATTFAEKAAKGFGGAQTAFAALCADDDLLLPDSIARCCDDLEKHVEHAAAIGANVNFERYAHRWALQPRVRLTTTHNGPSLLQHDPSQRLKQYFQDVFATAYAVQRSGQAAAAWERAATLPDPQEMHLAEILTSCLTIATGKIQTFDRPHALRQQHAAQTSRAANHDSLRPDPIYQARRDAVWHAIAEAVFPKDPQAREELRHAVADWWRSFADQKLQSSRRTARTPRAILGRALQRLITRQASQGPPTLDPLPAWALSWKPDLEGPLRFLASAEL